MTGSMAVLVSISADLCADLMRGFNRVEQKVKE
jgi:hypothetical protein